MDISRRRFLAGAAATGAGLVLPLGRKEQRALTRRFTPHPGKDLEWYERS